MNAQQQYLQILETHGGKIADRASMILLEDPALGELKPIFEFISKNWRDPLRPTMIKLSTESLGGTSLQINEVAVAMNLMNLGFYIWDDLIDQTQARLFKPTLYGKYGKGTALIIGGLVSAKAFTILNQIKMLKSKKQIIDLFWNMWAKMAEAETTNLNVRNQGYSSTDKLLKIEKEAAASIETCLRIGAIIGNGTKKEVNYLSNFGNYIGIIIELQQDFRSAINQTAELANKIKTGRLPYTLLWAKEKNEELQKITLDIANMPLIEPKHIEKIVQNILSTEADYEIYRNIEKLTEKALYELEKIEKKNEAIIALQSLTMLQPQTFKQLFNQ